MSTEPRDVRTAGRLRWIMVVAVLGMAVTTSAIGPQPAGAQASPAEPIAAALQQSPVYVDAALAAALPAAQQQQLAAAIQGGTVPMFVVLVPLVRGDAWNGKAESLAVVVRDRLGRDGVYITLSENSNGNLAAHSFPGGQYQAREAANAVNLEDGVADAGLYPKLTRVIGLIQSGGGAAAYEAARDALYRSLQTRSRPGTGTGAGSPSGSSDEGGSSAGWVPPVIAVALLGGAGAAMATRRRRRKPRGGAADTFRLPRNVFVAARQANEADLHARASAELLHFGELLDQDDFKPHRPDAQADLQHALDAYLAAGKVADAATRPVDWVGVLVLVDSGRDAYAAARAREAGERPARPSALCFFNPLHGDSARTIDWRPIGQRPRLHIPACATCVKAVKARQAPEVLTDRFAGHDMPYFEADPTHSLWAATAYGTLRPDLIPSILRGDFTRTRGG